jgi:hypothetical protein
MIFIVVIVMMYDGGVVISCHVITGVLLCTSHRLVFIQYPLLDAPLYHHHHHYHHHQQGSSKETGPRPLTVTAEGKGTTNSTGTGTGTGVVLCFPLSSLASVQVQRKHKGGGCIALLVISKDSTGRHYSFLFSLLPSFLMHCTVLYSTALHLLYCTALIPTVTVIVTQILPVFLFTSLYAHMCPDMYGSCLFINLSTI